MDDSLITLKYVGKKTVDGVMDARLSAEALLGFDKMMRHAIRAKDSRLKDLDFDLPVKVCEGSWAIVLPAAIGSVVITAYLRTLAKQAAKNGLFETASFHAQDAKKAILWAGRAISSFIKIANHVKQLADNELTVRGTSSPLEIEIINSSGQSLVVSIEHLEFFQRAPRNLLERNARIIEDERELVLEVGDHSESTRISAADRCIYVSDEDPDDGEVIFPELVHGEKVELEGQIIRINESTKTVGFRYRNHTLTIVPDDGHLEQYKTQIVSAGSEHIFSDSVIVYGVVDRENGEGGFKTKRPRVIFTDIRSMETPPPRGLYDNQ